MPSETKKTKISLRGITPNAKNLAGFARLKPDKLDQKVADAEARALRELERLAAARSVQERKKTASRDFALRTFGAAALSFVNASRRGGASPEVAQIAAAIELHVTRPGARKSLGLAPLTNEQIETIRRWNVIEPPDPAGS